MSVQHTLLWGPLFVVYFSWTKWLLKKLISLIFTTQKIIKISHEIVFEKLRCKDTESFLGSAWFWLLGDNIEDLSSLTLLCIICERQHFRGFIFPHTRQTLIYNSVNHTMYSSIFRLDSFKSYDKLLPGLYMCHLRGIINYQWCFKTMIIGEILRKFSLTLNYVVVSSIQFKMVATWIKSY